MPMQFERKVLIFLLGITCSNKKSFFKLYAHCTRSKYSQNIEIILFMVPEKHRARLRNEKTIEYSVIKTILH